MTRCAGAAAVALAAWAVSGAACASKARPAAAPAPPDLVVLLPDADGTVGGAVVSNPSGTTELSAARTATRVTVADAPSPAETMSDGEIEAIFGDTLQALPPPARHFTLYFHLDSHELTADSRALIPDIRQAVAERPAPEIVAIGHTDTSGKAEANYALGLKRAEAVRALFGDTLHASIEVASHGEADLLVPTGDNVLEPRNRRVEITVR